MMIVLDLYSTTTCGASLIFIALKRAAPSFIPTKVFVYALFSATKKNVIIQFIYLVMKEQNQLCQQQWTIVSHTDHSM